MTTIILSTASANFWELQWMRVSLGGWPERREERIKDYLGLEREREREREREWSGFREREAEMWLAMFGFSLVNQRRVDLGKSVPSNEQWCRSDGPRCWLVCLCLCLPTDNPTILILDSETRSGWFLGLCSIWLHSKMLRLRLRSRRWGLGSEENNGSEVVVASTQERGCGTLIGFESSASDERLMLRHWDGYGLVWQIVVVVIGFDGFGFDFCGRTQHPFFI